MLAACTGRGKRILSDRSGYPGRCRNGRYCAVSGGFTALNRITDVIRVTSPRITQRLYAIAPRGQQQRKATGRGGVPPAAAGGWERLARAPAAARSSSRALSRWPRWLRAGSPRRRSARAVPLRWPGPALSQRPPPLSALRGPVLAITGPRLAPLVRGGGWVRSASSAAAVPLRWPGPAYCNVGRPPSRPPPPPIPPSGAVVWHPPRCGVRQLTAAYAAVAG